MTRHDYVLFVTNQPAILAAVVGGAILGLIAIIIVTYFKLWGYLWREWFTTVDHKRIGIMYILSAVLLLVRGVIESLMMRGSTANVGLNLDAEHYNQVFTTHGVLMIFFVAMPLMFGLFNIVVPLQIGARDVAFPVLNSLSYWLFAVGAILFNMSFFIGGSPDAGWLAYPPLSGSVYGHTVGQDFYIWSIQISGIGSLMTGINFLVTILKMRAPGMTLKKMPVFCWSVLSSCLMVVATFPVLTIALAMLWFDRAFGAHYFTQAAGGNIMLYVNLIWAWGHPEVYILVVPSFGIFSEIAATFSRKKLFGYTTMVWALMVITVLSLIVWGHHFYTMGMGSNINSFFGIATMAIAIPTGVKIFNWLFTMFRGKVTIASPMLALLGFIFTFAIAGMTGVMLSVPAVNFQVHYTYFVVAHFHNAILGGVVLGYIGGLIYWWPKMFGYKLHEKLNKASFWTVMVGFVTTFGSMYILGFMGVRRRIYATTESPVHEFLNRISFAGSIVMFIGIVLFLLSIAYSTYRFVRHKEYADTTGDAWDGRTLEWSIPSPAPFYNFAHVPEVKELDDFWYRKQSKESQALRPYTDIHMPKNTPIPLYIAGSWLVLGIGLIFAVIPVIIIGGIGLIFSLYRYSFWYDTDYYVKKEEVEAIENKAKEAKAK